VLEIVEREAFGVGVDMWANPLLRYVCTVVRFVRCRFWYPSGSSGAFAAGYFAHVVGQHRSKWVVKAQEYR